MTTRSTLLSDARIDAIVRWLTDGRVMGILFGLFMLAVGISIGAHFSQTAMLIDKGWIDSFFQNAGTEMLGAFLTYFLIETLVGRRRQLEKDEKRHEDREFEAIKRHEEKEFEAAKRDEEKQYEATKRHEERQYEESKRHEEKEFEDTKRREEREEEKTAAIEELKQRLIRRLGSKANDEASRAAEELDEHGWLNDGSLQGSYLFNANLQGINLSRANLRGANLPVANLHGANLTYANLQGTNLQSADMEGARLGVANLQGANLVEANLQGAHLSYVNLQGAHLDGVNLRGAHLDEANLQDARLDRAMLDEGTMLPDETHWRPQTDLGRFTNPGHPEFWRSFNRLSPAYRGDA
jgi:uncharacterized protein YjbI with pentapeptide repeats